MAGAAVRIIVMVLNLDLVADMEVQIKLSQYYKEGSHSQMTAATRVLVVVNLNLCGH